MKRIRLVEEVCEHCGAVKEKFFVHLDTPTRDFYWCDLRCFEGDTGGWARKGTGTFVDSLSYWPDEGRGGK